MEVNLRRADGVIGTGFKTPHNPTVAGQEVTAFTRDLLGGGGDGDGDGQAGVGVAVDCQCGVFAAGSGWREGHAEGAGAGVREVTVMGMEVLPTGRVGKLSDVGDTPAAPGTIGGVLVAVTGTKVAPPKKVSWTSIW